MGDECEFAVAQTLPGSVVKIEEESGMTAFTAGQVDTHTTYISSSPSFHPPFFIHTILYFHHLT